LWTSRFVYSPFIKTTMDLNRMTSNDILGVNAGLISLLDKTLWFTALISELQYLMKWLTYQRLISLRYMEKSSPPTKGCKMTNVGRCLNSGSLSREGSLSCHTYCDMGYQFLQTHPKNLPNHYIHGYAENLF
jgi:hypothetical protein